MLWEGTTILWFNKRSAEYDLQDIRKGLSPSYRCFTSYSRPDEFIKTGDVVFPGTVDTVSYKKNLFTGVIPKKSTLYFTKDSKFPRTKISLSDYKRCIKLTKANYIVIDKSPNVCVTSEPYYLFKGSDYILAIEASNYNYYFNTKIDNLINLISRTDGISSIYQVFYGPLKCTDNLEFINSYNNGEYTVPFVYDSMLDNTINSTLPDPTLDELLAIQDMLASSDKGVIKLGGQMIAGYNVSKFPLTFRLLMLSNINWFYPAYGGSSVVIKQLKQTLGLTSVYRWNGVYNLQQAEVSGVAYSVDDVNLAKELAKNIPFVQESEGCFSDKIWCPDEYKI